MKKKNLLLKYIEDLEEFTKDLSSPTPQSQPVRDKIKEIEEELTTGATLPGGNTLTIYIKKGDEVVELAKRKIESEEDIKELINQAKATLGTEYVAFSLYNPEEGRVIMGVTLTQIKNLLREGGVAILVEPTREAG